MPCKYYDCGWCYAPKHLTTTDANGKCNRMQGCPQSQELPPMQCEDCGDNITFEEYRKYGYVCEYCALSGEHF